MMLHRAKRVPRSRTATAAVMAGATVLSIVGFAVQAIPDAAAAGVRAGVASIVTPAEATPPLAPLNAGGSATPFTVKLPAGAACAGDSATANYRVNSYMVPASVDPGTLTFNASGPTPVAGQFRQPLFRTTGTPYVNVQTSSATPPSPAGPIVQPLPTFNYAVFPAGTVPPGSYNVGIACTLGPASATQEEKYWNVVVRFTANPADSPGQLAWSVVSSPTFAPLSPARVWDSRTPGPDGGPIGPGGSRDIQVTGVGGVPATGVTAVVLNVTAVNPTASTYITVWPAGESQPLASNLNVPPNDVRPNLVIVKVGANGKVSFYNAGGSVNLIADVAGWYGPTGGQRYTSVSPARVWDSRTPGPDGGPIGPGGSRDIQVTGVGGVPATGVTAVVLNVTAVNPTASTYITVWPAGEIQPLASNLNVPPNDVRPNLVIVKVGASGKVSFYNAAGSVNLIADVAGWYGGLGT